jgi:hypothetical protein
MTSNHRPLENDVRSLAAYRCKSAVTNRRLKTCLRERSAVIFLATMTVCRKNL